MSVPANTKRKKCPRQLPVDKKQPASLCRPALLTTKTGQTVVFVLTFMLVLLFMSSVIITLVQGQQQNALGEEHFNLALNAAETGIETTVARVKGEFTWYEGLPPAVSPDNLSEIFPETGIDESTLFQVSAAKLEQEIGTSLALKSIGRFRNSNGEQLAMKTVKAEVGVYKARDYLRGLTVIPVGPTSLEFHENLLLEGDLVVNGDLKLDDTTAFYGTAYTSGNISGTRDGLRYPGYAYIPPFPDIDEEIYLNNAEAAGEVFYMDTSFGDSGSGWNSGTEGECSGEVHEYSGVYYVDGDITIGGVYRGTALFFATGNISVAADLVPEPGGDGMPDASAGMLALVALGDIDILEHTVYANILAGGALQAGGGAVLHGSACVTGINLDDFGSAEPVSIYHCENLAPLEDFIEVKTKIVEWKELYPVF